MMELGSEYNLTLGGLNCVDDNIFNYLSGYRTVLCFDSGRSAIKHLSKQLLDDSLILLPEFICESVTNCFVKKRVSYYKLNLDFTVDVMDLAEKVEKDHTVIFLMHYFGTLQSDVTLKAIKSIAVENNSLIIEDVTHSIFTSSSTIGDYMVCSIRKWLPISGGGLLFFEEDKRGICKAEYKKSSDNNRSYAMILKDLYLKGMISSKEEYRVLFQDCEKKMDAQTEIYFMSDFSTFVSSCISINRLKKIRRENFDYLSNEIKKFGIESALHFSQTDIPLVYPIRVKNRDKLRSYLISNNIFCAVHWPFDGHKPEERAFALANANELISLPIDQRYDKKHIDYLLQSLKNYGGDLLF